MAGYREARTRASCSCDRTMSRSEKAADSRQADERDDFACWDVERDAVQRVVATEHRLNAAKGECRRIQSTHVSVETERKWLLYELGHRDAPDGRGGELGCLQKGLGSLSEKFMCAAKGLEGTVADVTRRLHHVLRKHVAFDILLQQ